MSTPPQASLSPPRAGERLLFVTGRLAEASLAAVVQDLAEKLGFRPQIAVLGISVAALMHVEWVRRKLTVPDEIERVILPGWCQGELKLLEREFSRPFERGPKDLRDLPEELGGSGKRAPELTSYDIEILAEINHAPRMSDAEILARAQAYRDSGANLIDLGCVPGESWSRAGDVTRQLVTEGFRVSIDSFERREVEAAVSAGAELVLSCNGTNRDWAAALPAELVAIPDDPHDLGTLDETIAYLTERGTRYRIDPVLEPIGFGFAGSLGRYLEARRRWPEAEIMMGIGNLTELTEVDSAGINFLLAGFCQELGIRSVLTTEVINWCRSAVREFDLARRQVFHAVTQRTLPKHLASELVMLRDPRTHETTAEELERLRAQIRDPNFRLFAAGGELHAINRDGHRRHTDPFQLFGQLGQIDAAHAFYLGYELCKAVTALTLGKDYVQDEPLQWGFLTRPEHPGGHQATETNPGLNSPADPA